MDQKQKTKNEMNETIIDDRGTCFTLYRLNLFKLVFCIPLKFDAWLKLQKHTLFTKQVRLNLFASAILLKAYSQFV